jgi:signal transduction histidine kinase
MPLSRYVFQSLRFRLLAVSIAIVLLLFLATLWNTVRALRHISIDDTRSSIAQTAEALNLAVAPNTTRQDLPKIRNYFLDMVGGDDTRITYLALLDDQHRVIVQTPATPQPLPDAKRPIEQQIESGTVHVAQPILIYDNGVGSLRYGVSTRRANEELQRVVAQNMLALGLTLALGIGAILYFGTRLNRRITRLVRASSALADGDLGARSPLRGDDELALLSRVFNQMAQSIQERIADGEAKRAEISALNHDLERRVAERTIDLQEMVSGLESFNRSVSHDLRGPLGGIAGLAQMALQALERNDDSVARRVLPMIVRQSELSTHMLSSLLTLARVGDATLKRSPVALDGLVREVIDQLALATPDRALPEFVIHDLPTIEADPELLRPAFANLIGNAVKFTAKSAAPRVEIGARHQAPDPGQEADQTTIFIKDNGPGFDPAAAQRLFEPFVRLHGVQFEGHGVGLSIVRRAISRHGGRVWADAEPGSGACFYLTLPDAPIGTLSTAAASRPPARATA